MILEQSRFFALLAPLLLVACSGGSGGGGTAPATPGAEFLAEGSLSLSGVDTTTLGTQLIVGDIARLDGPGDVKTYYCLDEFSRVSGFAHELGNNQNPLPLNTVIADTQNFFIINAVDLANGSYGVSMKITVAGVEYGYLCTPPCPGLTVDATNQIIVFDKVTVMPSSSSAAAGDLTLDGAFMWKQVP